MKGPKEWSVSDWVKAVISFFTTAGLIWAGLNGAFQDTADFFSNYNDRKDKDAIIYSLPLDKVEKIPEMIAHYESSIPELHLPLILQSLYDERGVFIDSSHKAIQSVMDSISFDVMQLMAIEWSNMEKAFVTDNCDNNGQGGCKYWFRKDKNGTLWYRHAKRENGSLEFDHFYTVHFDATVGKWTYVTANDKKEWIKHNWEKNNN
jgi:hypothetical protein